MTSEERQQQINTLVERLRELDLEKRAMNLVLQDFLEQRKKDAERLSKLDEILSRVEFLKTSIQEETKKRKHSIASEAFCMNQVTFALQNIKIRLWQAVKILNGYWNFITRSPRQAVFR